MNVFSGSIAAIALGCISSLGGELMLAAPSRAVPPPRVSPQLVAEASPVPNGWQRLAGDGVSIALPARFLGGNPQTELDAIATQLESVIPDADQRLSSIRSNLASFALVAFDAQLDETGFLTNLNIATDAIPDGLTVDDILQATAATLAEQAEIVASETVEVNAVASGRMLTRSRTADVQQLFYLFIEAERLYVVVYSASSDEFEQQLPTFERSIRTFDF